MKKYDRALFNDYVYEPFVTLLSLATCERMRAQIIELLDERVCDDDWCGTIAQRFTKRFLWNLGSFAGYPLSDNEKAPWFEMAAEEQLAPIVCRYWWSAICDRLIEIIGFVTNEKGLMMVRDAFCALIDGKSSEEVCSDWPTMDQELYYEIAGCFNWLADYLEISIKECRKPNKNLEAKLIELNQEWLANNKTFKKGGVK